MIRSIVRQLVKAKASTCLPFSSSFRLLSSSLESVEKIKHININWVLKDGSTLTTRDPIGGNLMRCAHRHDIELEGACEGVCACSTCHVIFTDDVFDNLPEASEDEEDMLDQAFQLTPTSRLGCQVILTEDMDGLTVQLPKATRNFAVDGHFNKPH